MADVTQAARRPPRPRLFRGAAFCVILRKEVIQPHLPIRLPCYDLVPLTGLTFGGVLTPDYGCSLLGWLDGRCVQGSGTHSPRRADARLLAIPTFMRAGCSPQSELGPYF